MRPNEDAQYVAEKRTIQVLDVLKKISDENHPVTQAKLLEAMRETGDATTENAATLSATVDQILRQVNPAAYWQEDGESNDAEYRIKYKGYDDPEHNPLDLKEEIAELKRARRRKGSNVQAIDHRIASLGKAPSITELRYVHDFSDREMNQLIRLISFSNMLTPEDKEILIRKLLKTASQYFTTSFYDATRRKLKFHPKGIFSRTYVMPDADKMSGTMGETPAQALTKDSVRISLGQNISAIQHAINEGVQIRFLFCEYTAEKKLIPRKISGKISGKSAEKHLEKNREYRISPYYIVVYHDMYYLIGNVPGKDGLSHYRIDLMADIEPCLESSGKTVKRTPMSKIGELQQMGGQWDPVRYMSEHLYMGYDTPRKIRLKIPQDQYTVLHDWFGDRFRKVHAPCEEGFDQVEVTAPPSMMVHWALQYAGTVEVLDEEVREMIRDEIKQLKKKYVNSNK